MSQRQLIILVTKKIKFMNYSSSIDIENERMDLGNDFPFFIDEIPHESKNGEENPDRIENNELNTDDYDNIFSIDDGDSVTTSIANKMPDTFYSQIEDLMSKPAPKIMEFESEKKFNEINEYKINKNVTLKQTLKPHHAPQKNIQKSNVVQSIPNEIDQNLLQQAFAYVNSLSIVDLEDDEPESTVKNKSRMIDSQSINKISHVQNSKISLKSQPKKLNKKMVDTKKTYVSRLRNQIQDISQITATTSLTTNNPSSFAIESNQAVDFRRNVLDYDDLITNFQRGTNVKKLREELEESKISVAKSNDFIRQLTQDFSELIAEKNTIKMSK